MIINTVFVVGAGTVGSGIAQVCAESGIRMRRRNSRYGLECICGGGGLGIAAVFERVSI
jgi:3-hydroxyacyl-CoA dehydrogenase